MSNSESENKCESEHEHNDNDISETNELDSQYEDYNYDDKEGFFSLKEPKGVDNPFPSKNPFTFFSFNWMSDFIKLGNTRAIEITDTFYVHAPDDSKKLTARFLELYEQEKIYAKEKGVRPSVWKVIIRQFWKYEAFISLLCIIEANIILTSSILLSYLIDCFNENSKYTTTQAYLFAMGLSMSTALYMLSHHILFFNSYKIGMQVRTTLMGAVFNKTLTLNYEALGQTSTGHLINLMSNDVMKFDMLCIFICYGAAGMYI